MNSAFDLDNKEDFVNLCSKGNICPHKLINIRNISGTQSIQRPFLNHATLLCDNNNIDLLTLLTEIHDKVNTNIIDIGDNIPLVKNKINGVIDEWPNTNELNFEDLFYVKPRSNFDYRDLLNENEAVSNLRNEMKQLQLRIDNGDLTNIHDNIHSLQQTHNNHNEKINLIKSSLDELLNNYNLRQSNDLSKILMDLSTKPKQFYMLRDQTDALTNSAYQNSYRQIPDTLPDIILNSILISNMITKELEYLSNLSIKLKMTILNNLKQLMRLKDLVPKKQTTGLDDLQNFISSLLESDEEDNVNDKPSSNQISDKTDIKKVLTSNLNYNLSEDESSSEEEEPEEEPEEDSEEEEPEEEEPEEEEPEEEVEEKPKSVLDDLEDKNMTSLDNPSSKQDIKDTIKYDGDNYKLEFF